ncbi:MAG: sigma 54-interacting transcriptional regulator [Candidatus Hydrogenedentales bacterium]
MALFRDSERTCADALVGLGYCNPFLPERIDFERAVLGKQFIGTNIGLLTQRAKSLADSARERLVQGEHVTDAERALYEDVALHFLYNDYAEHFFTHIIDLEQGHAPDAALAQCYDRFQEDVRHYLGVSGATFSLGETAHLFACFFQLRRAFHHIYDNIIGGSMASARLRAAVWQSIFTCDMRRYRRALYDKMGDITTLVTGPSGTGKELVARAIGLSRYISFDARAKRFTSNFTRCFYPINLSALSPALIESELFGHAKGSFTGAIADRAGFFEQCPSDGAVFLDEIGELDPPIQVKLLRVLQVRTFQRIGDPAVRRFEGKVIAATNRDPAKEMQEGRFRDDLYYRLCSDIIVTPRLREQLEGSPEQLHNLLLFITRRVAGTGEAEVLAEEVALWIRKNLPADYDWPGNVRELEQCVRNILVRKSYTPFKASATSPRVAFLEDISAQAYTVDELVRRYCTLVYAETESYQETARQLGLDRRTIKAHIDSEFLAHLRGTQIPKT